MLTRRRFLAISAACAASPAALRAQTQPFVWTGVALGARASLRLTHPEAPAIAARVAAEIDRLEGVFSLYRTDSALMELNRSGRLDAPPFELLECLSLAGSVHRASGGLFDPTVQPLWAAYAEAAVQGRLPDAATRDAARRLTGWDRLRIAPDHLRMDPGMGLTLNGIAQGYIADRVATMLQADGLTDILIDTGELRALGGRADGDAWPVRLAQGGAVALRGRALATSAPLGTTFDAAGHVGHILNPLTGFAAAAQWRGVSISAPSAALADALSTAACLMEGAASVQALCARFADVRLEALV